MATTQLKPAEATTEGAAPEQKKSKKKLMIIAVVLLVVLAGAYLKFGKKKSAVPPPPKPGEVVTIEPITVNLAGGHYLKLGLALQATATAKEPPDGSKALDLAIDEFSNKSVAELSANKARAKYKAELLEKVIEAYEDKSVMDLYFTEFVMQ
jgi:flagellar FliL protein